MPNNPSQIGRISVTMSEVLVAIHRKNRLKVPPEIYGI